MNKPKFLEVARVAKIVRSKEFKNAIETNDFRFGTVSGSTFAKIKEHNQRQLYNSSLIPSHIKDDFREKHNSAPINTQCKNMIYGSVSDFLETIANVKYRKKLDIDYTDTRWIGYELGNDTLMALFDPLLKHYDSDYNIKMQIYNIRHALIYIAESYDTLKNVQRNPDYEKLLQKIWNDVGWQEITDGYPADLLVHDKNTFGAVTPKTIRGIVVRRSCEYNLFGTWIVNHKIFDGEYKGMSEDDYRQRNAKAFEDGTMKFYLLGEEKHIDLRKVA